MRIHCLPTLIRAAAGASFLLILCLPLLPATAQEMRTWTDKSGQHRIEATFVNELDGTVTLNRKDGKQVTIPLNMLGDADQKLVAELKTKLAKSSPFKVEDETASAAEGQPKVVSVDLSSAREVAAAPLNSNWSFPNAPAAKSLGGPLKSIAYSSQGFKYEGTAVSLPSKRFLLSFARRDKQKYSDPKNQIDCRFVLGDVARGSVVDFQIGPVDATRRAVALSSQGNSVIALRTEWGFGKSDRLELWRLTKNGIEREHEWTPYDKSKGGNRDVKWTRFLSGDRAVTVSGGGTLIVWDLSTIKPVFRFPIKGGSTPGLSPDGKLLCYTRGDDVGILDLEQGSVLAAQKVGRSLTWPNLRFSPDGTRIACVDHQRLLIWDFKSGQLTDDVPKRGFPHGEFRFVGPHHLLLAGRSLYDIENQLIVWDYQGAAAAEEFGEYCCFVAGSGRSSGLVMFEKLPQKTVTDALARAMEDPQFWVLQRGTTVRLDLRGIQDGNQQRRIGELLARKLAEQGMHVGNNGTIDLVASVKESPQKKEVSYSRGFSPFARGGVPLKVREFTTKLAFVFQGKSAWEQSGTNIPGSLSIKDGEAITDALRRHEKPNFAWYDRVELPLVLRKPTGSPTLGTTKVTDAGLR